MFINVGGTVPRAQLARRNCRTHPIIPRHRWVHEIATLRGAFPRAPANPTLPRLTPPRTSHWKRNGQGFVQLSFCESPLHIHTHTLTPPSLFPPSPLHPRPLPRVQRSRGRCEVGRDKGMRVVWGRVDGEMSAACLMCVWESCLTYVTLVQSFDVTYVTLYLVDVTYVTLYLPRDVCHSITLLQSFDLCHYTPTSLSGTLRVRAPIGVENKWDCTKVTYVKHVWCACVCHFPAISFVLNANWGPDP